MKVLRPLLKFLFFCIIRHQVELGESNSKRMMQRGSPKDCMTSSSRSKNQTRFFSLIFFQDRKSNTILRRVRLRKGQRRHKSFLCLNIHLYTANSPFWMLQNRNHQFHCQGSCNHGQSWTTHSALLVQGPVFG